MDEITKQTVREISAEIDKRLTDKIIEKSNAELLKKLLSKAESPTEAFAIAALGTTYKRTGFHFDKRLERVTDSIRYLKKNEALSFTQEENALTHTLVIGDNYPALLNLIVQYRGKIDVIYIDPPYGKDDMGDFAKTNYNNDITRDNLLSMLYPRLQLAKRLLSDTGVIFCSIDDRNQAYVKGLFDEVFGEGNFVANINVLDNLKGKENDNFISKTSHYVITYVKQMPSKDEWGFNDVIDGEDIAVKYNLVDENGDNYTINTFKKTGAGKNREDRPLMFYPILVNKKTKVFAAITDDEYSKIYYDGVFNDDYLASLKEKYSTDYNFILPQDKDGAYLRWTSGFQGYKILLKSDMLILNSGEGVVQKKYPKEIELIMGSIFGTPKNFVYKKEFSNGTSELADVIGKDKFANPKSVALIKYLLSIIPNKDALVLDFFAGSGTTGQAVLELNQEDGGRRKFILCTNNEVGEDEEIDFFTKKGLLPPMPTEKAEKEKWDTLHKILKDTKEYKKLAETEELKTLGIAYNVTSKRLKRVMTGSCYDGTNNFKWLEKHSPLGDNLLVLDVAEEDDAAKVNSLKEGERLPDKIDETLYGKKKMPLAEKIQWLMNNFENAGRILD